MCRRFLLLLSITYTHIWYLYGLKILWYYHGTHSNKRHDLRNHQCLEHERCTTNLYLCWWYKQSSNTMCEQQKQWRLAYGTLLAGVFMNKHAGETECSDELLSGGHLDSCRAQTHVCCWNTPACLLDLRRALWLERCYFLTDPCWTECFSRFDWERAYSNRRWCMLPAENWAALCFNWVLYRKATVLENSDGSDGEDGQHPSLFC